MKLRGRLEGRMLHLGRGIEREKVLPVCSLHSETVSVTDLCDKIKANFTVVTRIPSAVAQRIPYLLVVFNPAFF